MAPAAFMPQEAQDKAITAVGAFGTAVGMSYILRPRPELGITLAALISLVGFMGSLWTKGLTSEVLEGVACAGVASVGAQVPDWLDSNGNGGETSAPAASRNAPRLQTRRTVATGRVPLLPASTQTTQQIDRGVVSNSVRVL